MTKATIGKMIPAFLCFSRALLDVSVKNPGI